MSALKAFGLVASLSLLVSVQHVAAGDRAKSITIERPWARASITQSRPGVAYLTIVNRSAGEDRLLEASSPIAGRVMIHETREADGVMSMRHHADVPIAAGQSVVFAPGGLHLMLMQLTQPLRVGETLPLSLRFEHAGSITIEAPIRPIGATGPK